MAVLTVKNNGNIFVIKLALKTVICGRNESVRALGMESEFPSSNMQRKNTISIKETRKIINSADNFLEVTSIYH